MVDGDTAVDNAASGFVALEEVVLTTTPTGSSYSWALAKPSDSTARCVLSSTTVASPTITPDVGGFYTLTCVVDGVTTYVLRISVEAIASVATLTATRYVPIANVSVPTPATGRTVFSSVDLNALAEKLPDGNTYQLGGIGGGGGGRYATVAAMKAISATALAALDDGVSHAYVATLKSWFVWDASSTVADDTTDYLSVSVTANGVAAGRWRRLSYAHPSWLAKTAWFVSTAGSNENDGSTSLTPVKTDAEIQRRWGGPGVRARISADTTITYAQSPVTKTSIYFETVSNVIVKLVGTPTVTKAGTVLTAVQAQVRTAGAEAAWAVTAPAFDATDVGKLMVITASGTGDNVNAYAPVLKDETGGKLRVGVFVTFNESTLVLTAITPQIGDTVEIRDMSATTILLDRIDVRTASQDLATLSRVQTDSLLLDGGANGLGTVASIGAPVHHVRTVLKNLVLTGQGGPQLTQHVINGGLITGSPGLRVRGGSTALARCGALDTSVQISNGVTLSIFTDTYFQNSLCVGGNGLVASQGAALFDRSTSNSTIQISGGGVWQQIGSVPDWGTGNAGYAITIASLSGYHYATKPTVNSGLGSGREARVGGVDTLYSAIPAGGYVNPDNGASIVLTA